MKRVIALFLILSFCAVPFAEAGLISFNGIKKRIERNLKIFGSDDNHHKIRYYANLPFTPDKPKNPLLPLDPTDPGPPIIPIDPGPPINPVPEPASIILVGLGLITILLIWRKRHGNIQQAADCPPAYAANSEAEARLGQTSQVWA